MRTRQPGRSGEGPDRRPAQPPQGRPASTGAQRERRRAPRVDRDREQRRIPADREILYGRNAVTEALRGRRTLYNVIFAESVRPDDRVRRIEEVAAARGVRVDRAPRELLDELAPGNHQGVILEASRYVYADLDEIRDRPGTVLIFDHLQDPQNLGTLIRTAEAAGASGVIIAENRAAEITPAVVNASAGAVEILPVAMVPNLANAVKALRARGWWVAALDSGPDAIDIQTADLPYPLALIIGSEGEGVSTLLRKSADLVLSIPMVGKIESLNAATAGSIAVYELLRRERNQNRS